MQYSPSSLYTTDLVDCKKRLGQSIDKGLAFQNIQNPVELFFRADDIGVPSKEFAQLITVFRQHNCPLCLATVPSWLTVKRLNKLRQATGADDALWCWHQHGRTHRNYELRGKKQEFGPGRDAETVTRHLKLGRERLEMLLGNAFQPFFTPPWNRCSQSTLDALQEFQFLGLSRSRGAKPVVGAGLPDFFVNVDLHTRKEDDPQLCFNNLLIEIELSLASGRCGVMIHHQRMNQNALELLDMLVGLLLEKAEVKPLLFQDLV